MEYNLTDGNNILTLELDGLEAFIVDPETDETIDYVNLEEFLDGYSPYPTGEQAYWRALYLDYENNNSLNLIEEIAFYFGLEVLEDEIKENPDEWDYYTDEDFRLDQAFERESEIALDDWFSGFDNLY